LGAPPPSGSGRIPDIVSLHRRSARADLGTALSELEKGGGGAILKLAVEIHDFAELKRGHGWWLADPKRRAFLPRSADGRWRWYRSLFGARMPLHFVREGDGSGADQPFLWQAVLQPPFTRAFAAVLGRPVRQSFSPAEHHAFFAARGMPFVAIDLGAEELAPAFGFLRELGLSHAAVTSPLKAEAAGLADDLSEAARELGAANTLYLSGSGKVYADNTDVTALRALAAERPDGPVWLWGGGGVKPAVLAAWPGARAIPARQGCASGEAAPAVLIWAAPRGREFKWPPADLRPGLVLDLNYTGDSPGREWAVERGVPYQSGLKMFKLQAEAQRAFWRARDGI
jgi:shikimate 5-dehydrogenase